MAGFPSFSLTLQSCSSTPAAHSRVTWYRREVQDIMCSDQQVPTTFSPCSTVFFAFHRTPSAADSQQNRHRNRECEWRLPQIDFTLLRHREGNQCHFDQVPCAVYSKWRYTTPSALDTLPVWHTSDLWVSPLFSKGKYFQKWANDLGAQAPSLLSEALQPFDGTHFTQVFNR